MYRIFKKNPLKLTPRWRWGGVTGVYSMPSGRRPFLRRVHGASGAPAAKPRRDRNPTRS